MVMTLLFITAVLFLGLQMLTLLTNLLFFPVLKSGDWAAKERVSILIPARDEEANLLETLPHILAQKGVFEVIVLDDHSSDRTAEILLKLSSKHPKLKVLQGALLPPGWTGKNWACHQLAQAASGEIFIFTDADVFWEAGTLAAVMAFKNREQANYLSIWPRQRTHSWLEHLTVPLIDMILLGLCPTWG